MTPKASSVKKYIDWKLPNLKIKLKFYLSKLKNFCSENEKTTTWEKIFANIVIANHNSNHGPVPIISKEFSKLNNKKANNPVKKWETYLDRSPKRIHKDGK